MPFLKQSDHLDEKDPFGRSLLYIASCNGHLEIVRLLIEFKQNVNECDNLDRSPLSVAAENRYYPIVKCLLDAGADPSKVDSFGRTALHYAVKAGCVVILSIILQHGHRVFRGDHEGKTPLHFCARYGTASMTNLLLTTIVGIFVNQCDLHTVSPLHEAIENQQLDVVRILLSHGADTNIHDANGRTALHLAAGNGSVAAVDILIKGGAQINVRDNLFQTPVFLAALNGRSVLKDLIENGADLNLPDDKGRTPLHASILSSHLFAAIILIQHKANINTADEEGKTPLHLAVDFGNVDLVDLLLKADASIIAVDVNNRTPLHFCTSTHVLTSLIQNGVSVNSEDKSGKTLLHNAVEYLCDSQNASNKTDEYLSIVNELLSNGANVCLRDNSLKTVIHKVVHASNYHLLTELLRFDFDSVIRETFIDVVNDCLPQSEHDFVTDVLKRWLSIQQTQKDNEQLEYMYTQQMEVCPPHLLQDHEEWLRKHKCVKRANVLRRVMSSEKDNYGGDGRKRKESVGSTLIEPLEKMLKVQGHQDCRNESNSKKDYDNDT